MKRTVLFLLLIVVILAVPNPAAAADPLRVYYAGPEDGGVRQALLIDQSIELVGSPSEADVLVLNGAAPNPAALAARVQSGAGLVLLLGPDLTTEQVSTLLGENVTLEFVQDPLSLNPARGSDNLLLNQIVWTSAPQIRQRYQIEAPGYTPLVTGFENGELVLGERKLGSGQVYVFTGFLGSDNPQLKDWTYFNYLVYLLAHRAAGQTPDTFAAYPGSPVPHSWDRLTLFGLLTAILGLCGWTFWRVRRYSLAHPEALDTVVANRAVFIAQEAGTDWEEIGFHRPLGGFFMALFLGLVLFVPLIIYQNLILPVYILPSAQALGIWGRVTQFFNLIWTFFDMGTSIAFIKYLSEYRIHDPQKGIRFGQIFVWWQALSGAVQVALMVALASTVLPSSAYAIYAWSIIFHTFIQIPGFYQVMRHALTGLQRFDFAQILDLGLALVFPMITQPIFVLLMVAWGKGHPIFGASMGGLLGLGVAAYAAEALAFVLGLFLYRRLGLNARVYFLAHFNWSEIKQAFRFGVYEMLGSAAWGVGQSVEILITQSRLVNYAEVWGNWVLAQNFVYGFNVLTTLYANVMPSISEAISHNRKALSRYYAAVSYKWGGMISAMLAAMMISVADRFILGASGPEFARAAAYSVPLLLWGAVQYPSWVGDNVQRGANRPWIIVLLVGMEQTIRIVLALLLVERFQINALIFAYFVGIFIKNIVGYFVNDRLCFKQSFYFWQSLGAPILAGVAHYLVLRQIGGWIWHGDQISSIIIFFIAILPSYPLYAFFYGLFGGWDVDSLEEVKRAVKLSSFMRPLAWLFWAASDLGARISPLHNRFPITIRAAAEIEAKSLTAERVEL